MYIYRFHSGGKLIAFDLLKPLIERTTCEHVRSDQRAIGQWPATLALAKGFGDPPKSTRPKQPADGDGDGDAARKNKAKSLMPLADAASKLLPKESADGSVKFSNPGVGDFQVFDALVKVRSRRPCNP